MSLYQEKFPRTNTSNHSDQRSSEHNQITINSQTDKPKQKLIGNLLMEAGLVSKTQLELALQDQEDFPNLRLGEIMAMRGWINAQTADFFVEDWSNIVSADNRKPLGEYLAQSAILETQQIEEILAKQKDTGVRFGAIAVMQGLLRSITLDFFIDNLFPKEAATSPFISMNSSKNPQSAYAEDEDFVEIPIFFEDWEQESYWEE